MRFIYSLLASCLVLTMLPNFTWADSQPQDWQMHAGDQGNTNYSAASLPVDLTLKKEPFNNASSLFTVNQNQLYSAERIEKKILSATDLDTNKEKWDFSTDNKDAFLDMVSKDSIVFASTMNKLYAIQDNGSAPQTLWAIDTFANRLLVDQNKLIYYTRNSDDTIEAIAAVDTKTGAKKWNYTLKTNEKVSGVLTAGGNRLYAIIRNPVTMTTKVYAFDISSGIVQWTLDLDPNAAMYGNLVYKDEQLFLETKNTTRNILAFDALTGKTLWKYNAAGTFTQPLSVTSDSVIVMDNTNLIAIDKNSGVQKWKTMYADQFVAGGLQTVTGSRGMVVASDKIIVENHNKLNFFNAATGQLISKTIELSTPTGGVGVRPIGVINDTLFVTESNGCLYTYSVPKPSQADTEKPTASIDLAAANQFSVQDGKNQIKIPVTISEEADMDVTVVDQTGLPVRTIGWDRHLKGTSYFYWDGKDSRGFNVTRGNYYIIVKLTDLSGNKNEYVANDKLINMTEGFGLTVKNANLRSDANTLSTVLRTIPVGSEVTVTGETGDWYQVEYRIVSAVLKGYVSKPLINVPSNQQISNIVAGKTRINANVRNFAGTQYDTKKILPAGTDVSIVSAIGDWYVVEYQKDSYYRDQGYVAKYLITLPTSTSMVYTVISGDTLWKIAQKNGVTIDSIVKANNLDPAKPLYIGHKLTIVK